MFRTTVIAATLSLAFAAAAQAEPLHLQVYTAGPNSFNVNSTLVYGAKEAVVIDAGFTRSDALRIAANVLDSGRQLKTILVSQADPDYYFGVETLKSLFPAAEVVATPAVLEKIQAKLAGKLAYWGPKMGANAPVTPVLPKALQGNSLSVDGEVIELRGTQGLLAHRPYVWIPSIKTVTGALGVFGQMHVWTADTQTVAERAAWVAQLDEMAALKPEVVVPGHMAAATPLTPANLSFTSTYLKTFEQQLAKGANSAAVVQGMSQAYPGLPGAMSLDLGAKVNKGEMKW